MAGPVKARLLGRYADGSPEWHQARLSRIGGSEVAAIFGKSPWQSRFSLWCLKKGWIEPEEDRVPLWLGHQLEPIIAKRFAIDNPGLHPRRTGTWVHPERDWQLANPDYLLAGSILECKTDAGGDEWGDESAEEIPPYYRIQVLWYMDVLGLDHAWISVLVRGSSFRHYRIAYNAGEAALLRAEAEEFLRTLEADEPPDIDEHSATYQAIRVMHPLIDGSEAEIDPQLAENYMAALSNFDAASKLKQLFTSELADAMGNAQTAVSGEWKLAIRMAKKGGTPYIKSSVKKIERKVA